MSFNYSEFGMKKTPSRLDDPRPTMISPTVDNEFIAGDAACPACHSAQLARMSRVAHDGGHGERVSVLECQQCHLAWQYPLSRTPAQSVVYFADQYAAAQDQSYFDKDTRLGMAALQLKFVQSLRPQPTTLLDIGAGDGTFIDAAAQAGWTCLGLEPAASPEFHRTVTGGGSATLTREPAESLQGRRFDVVTLWDVIEHVERPVELLRMAASLLSDNGVLVVETGNYCSADRLEGGNSWWCYQLDHRWYFSPTTLQSMFQGLQLPHLHLADRVFRPWWGGSVPFRCAFVVAHGQSVAAGTLAFKANHSLPRSIAQCRAALEPGCRTRRVHRGSEPRGRARNAVNPVPAFGFFTLR